MKTQSVNPPSERRGAVGRSLRRLVSGLKSFAILLAVIGVLFGLCLFDFWTWSMQHPSAPTWTYFFSSR